MTMPDPAKLANKLSNVAITDNYSKFANLVTVTGANVYENERNATSDYFAYIFHRNGTHFV